MNIILFCIVFLELLTLETCPHYLTLRSEKVPRGATEYKCCPPIRNKINQDRLWDALNTSSFSSEYKIDCVVSDHSPCTPKLKAGGNFLEAWGGIASVQLRLSLFWTEVILLPTLVCLIALNIDVCFTENFQFIVFKYFCNIGKKFF